MNATQTLRRPTLVATCATLCLAAPSASAGLLQSALPAGELDPVPALDEQILAGVIRSSHGVSERHGHLQADGPDYRADFGPGGLVYTPALGTAVERALPLSFRLEDVRRGGALVLAADGTVVPRRSGQKTVSFDHAGGIEERYESRADGLYQSFHFPSRPEGSGDLVVRGRVATELEPLLAADGLRFEREGIGGVRWGEVTGIDANGWTASGELRLVGSELELVLPGAFVDAAAYPMVLDPLIGSSFDVKNDGNNDYAPDVAYDATTARYLVVWNRSFALNQIAIRGQLLTSTGTPDGITLSISETILPVVGRTSLRPSVANVNLTNRFLVAWHERIEPTEAYDVKVVSVDPDTGTFSSVVELAPSGADQTSVDVGGNRLLDDDVAVVVYRQEGSGIRLARVAVPAGASPEHVGVVKQLASDGGSIEHSRPSIAKSGGTTGTYLVAWQRMDTSDPATPSGKGRIEARAVSSTGVLLGGTANVSGDLRSNERPSVDGDGQNFVVAWQRQESFFPAKYDLMARGLAVYGAALEMDWNPQYLEADVDDHEHTPAVAWTPGRAVICFIDEGWSNSEFYLAAVDPFSASLGEGPMYVGTAEDGQILYTGITSGWAAAATGPAFDDVLAVFHHKPSGGPDGDVLGARYDCPTEPATFGLKLGGDFGANHAPLPHEGNGNFRAHLRGANPASLTFFVAAPFTSPVVCGASTWYPSLSPANRFLAVRVTDAFGNAWVDLAIPGGTAGMQFYTQWATKDPAGECDYGNGWAFSNALEVTVEP